MLQLLIDGHRVNLSSDTSFEFYDRNPLFSKEGQHTLDIDINLSDPVNANVYKNMYRIDVLRRPSGRSAVLFSERGVIIRGTEVVLQVDDRVAKIQLVAGNSELNYLSGGDSYIKDLDLGEITNLDITTAAQSLQGTYPTWDYVCAPVCTQLSLFHDQMPVLYKDFTLMNGLDRHFETSDSGYVIDSSPLDVESTLSNVYLKKTGDLQNASGWSVKVIEIPENVKKLYVSGVVRAGSSTTYSFYSSNEFSASTLVEAGIVASRTTEDSFYVDVPEGATYIGVTWYRAYNPSVYACVPVSTIELNPNTTLCPQPYLAAMVRKVITALGYTITNNFIETNACFRKIILVNGYHAVKYNEMVPNWKVDEFLSEVEKFTGCIIVVNQAEKTVQILQMNAFYQNAAYETVDADDVIGEIDKKFDEDSPEGVLYHNVAYKFPDSEIYRYWSVSREFMNSLTIQQCPNQGTRVQDSRLFYFLIDIWTALNGGNMPSTSDNLDVPQSVADEYNKMIAYEDLGMPAFGTYFVLRNAEKKTSCLRRLNYYGPRYDNRTDDTMELRIVPAEVVWYNDHYIDGQMWCQPYLLARNSDIANTVTSEDNEKGLNEYIAGEQEQENNADLLYAAFYLGLKDNNFSEEKSYPIMSPTAVPSNEVERFYSSEWSAAFFASYWTLQEIISYGEPQCCMAINGQHGMYNTFWKNNLPVNFTQPYTIRFRNTRNRDPRNIFVIANKKFYCQQLKYNIDAGKVSEIVEGTFFPLIGDADTPHEGEDINILVRFDTLNGYVKLYADKTLDYPITVRVTGTKNGTTYSAFIPMAAGTAQKSVTNEWIAQCDAFTASVYAQESDDPNNYIFNVVVDSYDTINITVTLSGTNATATADAPLNGSVEILLVIRYGEELENVHINMNAGDTTATATARGNLDTRTGATATPYSLDPADRTVYEVSINE